MHNAKEMVNLQGLFVLIVGTLTKYYNIIERVYFIYRLFILFISTLSFLMFLYTVSLRRKRDYRQYRHIVLYYVLYY